MQSKDAEGDLVLMSIDALEKQEQMLKLRKKVLQAEQERLGNAPTLDIARAREQLKIIEQTTSQR